jgi:hypothetical protein
MKIQVQKIKVFKLKNYTLKDAECNICKIKFYRKVPYFYGMKSGYIQSFWSHEKGKN